MYAVIQSGGKQYRVSEGDVIRVEKLDGDQGTSIELDTVLAVGEGENIKVGAPYVDGGKVTAEITGQGRGDKVIIIKFRRRKHSRKKMGHRQSYTELKITGISG